METALRELKQLAEANPNLDPGTVAAVTGFGAGIIKLTFIVYIKKGANYFETVNAVNVEALKRLKAVSVDLALPTPVFVKP